MVELLLASEGMLLALLPRRLTLDGTVSRSEFTLLTEVSDSFFAEYSKILH